MAISQLIVFFVGHRNDKDQYKASEDVHLRSNANNCHLNGEDPRNGETMAIDQYEYGRLLEKIRCKSDNLLEIMGKIYCQSSQ